MAFNWTCPYCNRPQVVTSSNYDSGEISLPETQKSNQGRVALKASSIVCSNEECSKIYLTAKLHPAYSDGEIKTGVIQSWNLLPDSVAKPQSDCVPKQLAADYYEACKIRDLSPKASATLARRCIQGMIRDFCGISKNRLIDEIGELQRLADSEEESLPVGVTEDTIEAIDHIRGIGNIGAHFEKDINLIVDVGAGEAQALIDLIEMLFVEWYVAREVRQNRLARIKEIGENKQEEKKQAKAISEQDNGSRSSNDQSTA